MAEDLGTRTRTLVMRTLDGLSLGDHARKAKRLLRHLKNAAQARVLWAWTPLVPEHALTECCRGAIRTLKERHHGAFGAYLEFGVSRGTSLAAMYRALVHEGLPRVQLYGFDSFEGMPAESLEEGWMPGDYRSTIGTTRKYLHGKHVSADRVTLVEGWFKDTLTKETADRLGLTKVSLIMVDCDIYSASRAALWFAEQFIVNSTVIIFDDWGWRADIDEIGQREAFAEFLESFPTLTAEPLPAYLAQARVFLVTRHPSPSGSID